MLRTRLLKVQGLAEKSKGWVWWEKRRITFLFLPPQGQNLPVFQLLFRILLDKWLVHSTKYLVESNPCLTIKEEMTVEKN